MGWRRNPYCPFTTTPPLPYSPIFNHLQGTEGKGFVAFVGVELVAHGHIDGADQAEEEGVEVFAGGKAGGDRGFG